MASCANCPFCGNLFAVTSPESHHPSAHDAASRIKPDRPLALRLYACPHLVEFVRLFGYAELPSDDAKRAMQPLVERFGRERMQAAADEVLDSRTSGNTTLFRLNDDVRRLAIQILGPATAEASRSSPSSTTPSSNPTKPAAPQAAVVSPPSTEPKAAPSRSGSFPTDHTPTSDAGTDDNPQHGIENFETFLIHFWLTGSDELCEYCMGLIEHVREDVPHCSEVTEQGWSLEAAATHYVARALREFVEQEALTDRDAQAQAELTRQTLDRVGWRELAQSLLTGE